MIDHELRYRILKILEKDPEISQRELAREIGISLGKINYCLQALIEKGWVKVNRFKNSNNKKAYAYFMTPSGIEEKAKMTVNFLKRKIKEYEVLKHEIEELKARVKSDCLPD